jgi:hypothetical protein
MQPSNVRRRSELAVILTFCALVLLPAVALVLGGGRGNARFIAMSELRAAATMPPQAELASQTGAYTRGVERVVADRFPLRSPLIEGYDWTKFVLFGDSSSDHVIRGRWLFLGEPQVRAYITGAYQASDVDFEYVVQVFQARADFCRKHGTRYIVVFPPDKSSIYPEYLPSGITLARPTMLERLVPRLRAAGIEIVDVEPALLEAKKRADVYSYGDTHWTPFGAYAAYLVLAQALRSDGIKLALVSPNALRPQTTRKQGDLARMSGVGRFVLDSIPDYAFTPRARHVETPQFVEPSAGPDEQPYATVVDDPSLPTAVMFGDSFSASLRPFVSEGFRRVLHVHYGTQPFNEHLIAIEHPDVVIQELVERGVAARGAQ